MSLLNLQPLQPSFICIGPTRTGTTFLYHLFCQHPQFGIPRMKEARFFDCEYGSGLNYYMSHFPFGKDSSFTGDITPTYFAHEWVPGRIFHHFPDIKLIILLRDPIDRAYSAWNFIKLLKREWMSFEDATEKETQRINYPYRKGFDFSYNNFGYLRESRYIEHIRRWHKKFNLEQMLFIKSEDLFASPTKIFSLICSFLKISTVDIKDHAQCNHYNMVPMKYETRCRLKEYFKPYNEQLYSFIRRDMKWQ